ncbi:MBL fold metallo-hydrolase [Pelotomaculum propionicicum]|uniref:MBL fold metallo-hydrolase n=1 Tax=Pelotomaculum propionicicum TaxID=258475 RepID=UPI003B81013F
MIQEILPDIYKIEVPLPGSPLKATNSYLIKGRERNLLIDTGWNREESREALFAGLAALDAVLEKTDILLTHVHADHSGLSAAVATEKSTLYCGEIDSELVNATGTPAYWSNISAMFGVYGFPLEEITSAMRAHPGRRYNPGVKQDFTILRGNDVIQVGDYCFTCIETPGHTPGHICLYEPKSKILVSGDHVLDDITPNITFEKRIEDSLGHYLHSLDIIDGLDIGIVLTGHRRLIDNIHKRIGELKQHHQNRINEVLDILGAGLRDAYRIAGQMTWDISAKSWELFPPAQKVFAVGEAVTHLEYLQHIGKVRKNENNGKVSFELIY